MPGPVPRCFTSSGMPVWMSGGCTQQPPVLHLFLAHGPGVDRHEQLCAVTVAAQVRALSTVLAFGGLGGAVAHRPLRSDPPGGGGGCLNRDARASVQWRTSCGIGPCATARQTNSSSAASPLRRQVLLQNANPRCNPLFQSHVCATSRARARRGEPAPWASHVRRACTRDCTRSPRHRRKGQHLCCCAKSLLGGSMSAVYQLVTPWITHLPKPQNGGMGFVKRLRSTPFDIV